MEQRNSHDGLLAWLKRLYTQLHAKIMHQRLNGYRQYNPATGMNQALAPLERHITDLSEQAGSNERSGELPTHSTRSSGPKAPPSEGTGILHGLTRYFRRRSSRVSIQPHLAEQLCDATRQHINTALTYARQGNRENAHIHLKLANNALHMAEHYMSEEEFQDFHYELEATFRNLDKEVNP